MRRSYGQRESERLERIPFSLSTPELTQGMSQTDTRNNADLDVALGYAVGSDRRVFESTFLLDRELANAVAASSEPMIAQLRLAWWRDALSGISAAPRTSALIASIRELWPEGGDELVLLVDGWEAFATAPELTTSVLDRFISERASMGAMLAERLGIPVTKSVVDQAMRDWVCADLAAHLTSGEERQLVLSLWARSKYARQSLPRRLRPLAVLSALGQRAMNEGGRAMMGARSDALLALRTGMFGR